MRKLLILVGLLLAGFVVGRLLRSRVPGREARTAPTPRAPARPRTLDPSPPPIERSDDAEPVPPPEPEVETVPPPPTTNGERVVLMSISSLQERGEAATQAAVVGHVAAGEVEPDEGTVDAVLHRLAGAGLLSGDGADAPYRLTPSGRAALLDGSAARRSPAGDAAEELSTPTTRS